MWYNMVKVTKGEKLMIKLVKSLVDDKHVLVGFIIQGKEREFGGMTDVEVARSIPLQSLRQSSFKNNQIKIERGSIVELGQFRVNTLPMGKIIGNDIIDMDNSITITKRFMMKERGRNQMRVITGIINKVISPSIITNYMSLLNSLHSSFQTNLTDDQMISLLRMQINDMSAWNIESISVDGNGNTLYSPIYGSSLYMMVPDDASVETAKQKINQLYQ